jgi:hypothetical protein
MIMARLAQVPGRSSQQGRFYNPRADDQTCFERTSVF